MRAVNSRSWPPSCDRWRILLEHERQSHLASAEQNRAAILDSIAVGRHHRAPAVKHGSDGQPYARMGRHDEYRPCRMTAAALFPRYHVLDLGDRGRLGVDVVGDDPAAAHDDDAIDDLEYVIGSR
jgi:hypothetical protein